MNGAPDRYDVVAASASSEMYIPANTYKVHENTVKYPDLVKPGHANPDMHAL
jgi:hypothetical protein